nr:L-serine ammonia-lyase [Bacteroidota bacterium]
MTDVGVITTSIFDLFKVGPGPSSSHTIGPMKAAFDFLRRINALPETLTRSASEIRIILYGSLAATGAGHGTDRAIAAGLLGKRPEECEPVWFSTLMLPGSRYEIPVGSGSIIFTPDHVRFERGKFHFHHPNTLQLQLFSGTTLIAEEEYYSVGGGFIHRKGETEEEKPRVTPRYPYGTMSGLKQHLADNSLSLSELIVRNEESVSGIDRTEIYRRVDAVLKFMHDAVRRGLESEGELPGSIKLHR